MANIRLIQRRIRGVQSTAKITRAMEMIATSKMRRAQERGLAGRAYSEKIQQVLSDLAALPQAGGVLHPLLQRRPDAFLHPPSAHCTFSDAARRRMKARAWRRKFRRLLDQIRVDQDSLA